MHGLTKNRCIYNFRAVIVALLAVTALFCSSAWSQSTPSPSDNSDYNSNSDSDDLIFQEILLTPDGVEASDTTGEPWTYDFQTENFRAGTGRLTRRQGRGEGGAKRDYDQLPVEERCTIEKHIRPGESHIVVNDDEYVAGNITASGRVTVRGWVQGNIKSFKKITVTESGQVDGDISAPMISLRSGSVVIGTVDEGLSFDLIPEDFVSYSSSAAGIWVLAGFALFFLLAGFLILTLVPTKMERVSVCLTKNPVRCFLLGLLFNFLFPMIFILLLLTIIGVLVVPVAYLLAYTLGIISSCTHVGQKLIGRFTSQSRSPSTNYLVGLAAFLTPWIITAILLSAGDSAANDFGIFFMVISILLTVFPTTAGVGASILTRFGKREYISFKQQTQSASPHAYAPAPPPIHGEPSTKPPGPDPLAPVVPPPLPTINDSPRPKPDIDSEQ